MSNRHFHQLSLVKKIRQTDLACTLQFAVPGQLKKLFKFKAGQYLTFKVMQNGEELRRSYSINSASSADEPLQVTVKKITDGRVSKHFVDDLKAGDILEVMPPRGQFVLPEDISGKFYFYAAGSGITPIFGLIKTLLHSSNTAQVNLQYGNYNRDQVIFYDEFSDLCEDFPQRLVLQHHYTDIKKPIFGKLFSKNKADNSTAGDFTADKLVQLSKEHSDFLQAQHYICGPGEMIPQLEKALLSIGVVQANIHHEYFAPADTPTSTDSSTNGSEENSDSFTQTKLTVQLDDETETLVMPAGQTVLQALLDDGLSPPFACESGVCATCKAKCLQGKVRHRSNSVLSDDELAQGYILTCQAEALTSILEVDYDVV